MRILNLKIREGHNPRAPFRLKTYYLELRAYCAVVVAALGECNISQT